MAVFSKYSLMRAQCCQYPKTIICLQRRKDTFALWLPQACPNLLCLAFKEETENQEASGLHPRQNASPWYKDNKREWLSIFCILQKKLENMGKGRSTVISEHPSGLHDRTIGKIKSLLGRTCGIEEWKTRFPSATRWKPEANTSSIPFRLSVPRLLLPWGGGGVWRGSQL